MPNWCEGNIRFRGNMSDILKCIGEIFEFCVYGGQENEAHELETIEKPAVVFYDETVDAITVKSPFDEPHKSWCHIVGTHRNFMECEAEGFSSATIVHTKYDSVRPGDVVVFPGFSAAWRVESTPYLEIAKKYNVDIAIFAWEQGAGFSRRIFIENGYITTDYTYDPPAYEIYAWMSEMPYLGG